MDGNSGMGRGGVLFGKLIFVGYNAMHSEMLGLCQHDYRYEPNKTCAVGKSWKDGSWIFSTLTLPFIIFYYQGNPTQTRIKRSIFLE